MCGMQDIDLVNDLEGVVLDHFDSVIGLDRLRALHINDSFESKRIP